MHPHCTGGQVEPEQGDVHQEANSFMQNILYF